MSENTTKITLTTPLSPQHYCSSTRMALALNNHKG